MKAPEPLIVAWQGRQVRVRHDDPDFGPYTHAGQVIRAAVELASDVDGLRLVLASMLGDRYSVRVEDDGSVDARTQAIDRSGRPSSCPGGA